MHKIFFTMGLFMNFT